MGHGSPHGQPHGGRHKKRFRALHLALDGVEGASAPIEWIISRVCEEFHCLPSQAEAELDNPDSIALEIIQLRAYAKTKAQIDRAKSEDDMPDGPMVDLVFDIQAELFQRQKEAD